MTPKTQTNQPKKRTRRKNHTIVPVLMVSAALFTSVTGFLGVQMAQGKDPMLGARVSATQTGSGAASTQNSSQSQAPSPQPTPVQTSTSGA
ncbi:MAG: hypothetical protein F2813_04990 [Actinobacteria bacterium]|uniref:Unannotated protein n=1 Tax=freshwater metagenome TaxID=449393 RepID=A0A6J5ZUL1_9ZZZZ|nr:hypothetical protein [Actinomycetota bacterium]